MALGTAAIIGLGGLALGAGSQVLAGKSANKAATKAADTSLQVANQNNALAQQIYGQNREALSPFMARGNQAGNALSSMLGLGQPSGAMQSYGDGDQFSGSPMAGATPQASGDPFRQFIQNSDYGFQFGEGANRINSGYAGAGTLQSGAAMQDLERFRQNLQSGYRGEFMNALGNQQGVGLSGASALAGVGQNYVNTISANNQNAGDAAANAALYRGANNPLAGALGMLGGSLYGMQGMKF
jgi:hypothetical protein